MKASWGTIFLCGGILWKSQSFFACSIHNTPYICHLNLERMVTVLFRKELLTPAYWNSTKLMALIPYIYYMYKRTGESCALKWSSSTSRDYQHCLWHKTLQVITTSPYLKILGVIRIWLATLSISYFRLIYSNLSISPMTVFPFWLMTLNCFFFYNYRYLFWECMKLKIYAYNIKQYHNMISRDRTSYSFLLFFWSYLING